VNRAGPLHAGVRGRYALRRRQRCSEPSTNHSHLIYRCLPDCCRLVLSLLCWHVTCEPWSRERFRRPSIGARDWRGKDIWSHTLCNLMPKLPAWPGCHAGCTPVVQLVVVPSACDAVLESPRPIASPFLGGRVARVFTPHEQTRCQAACIRTTMEVSLACSTALLHPPY